MRCRICPIVRFCKAECKDCDFAKKFEKMQAENRKIRQNSVSAEVYKEVCEERDAAVADLFLSNTRKLNNPCEICKHYGEECDPVSLQDVCKNWEWRGKERK